MKEHIVILGSTGKIGENALNVYLQHQDKLQIIGLAANTQIERLAQQAHLVQPQWVSVTSTENARKIAPMLPQGCKVILSGEQLNEAVCQDNVSMVLCAIVGTAGFAPVLAAIRAHKKIALASKEILVLAGELIMHEIERCQTKLIPVDSEHSAIYQCLQGQNKQHLKKIILTASGGPFFKTDINALPNIKPEQALQHPTWNMGNKITIDSATLMNKGLELIEAVHLFHINQENIDILIHPQSIIHSFVEFNDNSQLAQLSNPDMKIPIQYALLDECRLSNQTPPLQLSQIQTLNFYQPDEVRFPSLRLARYAAQQKGTLPIIYNAANEVAVEHFLQHKCKFTDIFKIVEESMNRIGYSPITTYDEILETEKMAKSVAQYQATNRE